MSSLEVVDKATIDRHDNNKKSILQIAIIPTKGEIRSK
jgi:hypothetical protein